MFILDLLGKQLLLFKKNLMTNITLSLNLVNAIMGYLGKQPYEQVFQLINAINDEAKDQIPKEEEKSVE